MDVPAVRMREVLAVAQPDIHGCEAVRVGGEEEGHHAGEIREGARSDIYQARIDGPYQDAPDITHEDFCPGHHIEGEKTEARQSDADGRDERVALSLPGEEIERQQAEPDDSRNSRIAVDAIHEVAEIGRTHDKDGPEKDQRRIVPAIGGRYPHTRDQEQHQE